MQVFKFCRKAIVKSIYAAIAAISFWLLIINLRSLADWLFDRRPAPSNIVGFAALFCLFALLAFILISTRAVMLVRSRAEFLSVLILVSFITKAWFVIGIDTPQYSDFALLLDTTYEIAEGSGDYLQLPYFKTWSYQTGFPAFMSIFCKLFGGSTTALLFVNCMFAAGTNALVYCISRLKTCEKTARAAAVIYMIFPYVLGLSSVYTNQHLATFLFYLGVYVVFRYSGSGAIAPLTAGLLLALGNSVRPEGILFVVSVAGYTILKQNKARGKAPQNEARGKAPGVHGVKLSGLLIIVASYFLFNSIASQIFIASGLNPNGLKNDFPLYKFAVGLNLDTNGCYSNEDVKVLFGASQESERDAEARRLIRERLSLPPASLVRLFKNKASVIWTAKWRYPAFTNINDDNTFDLYFLKVPVGRLNTMFTFIDYLIYLLLFLITFLSSLSTAAGKSDAAAPFFAVLFAATFAVYLIIEVQYRYAYVAMPALFILSAEGGEQLFEGRLFNRKQRRIKAYDNFSPDPNL